MAVCCHISYMRSKPRLEPRAARRPRRATVSAARDRQAKAVCTSHLHFSPRAMVSRRLALAAPGLACHLFFAVDVIRRIATCRIHMSNQRVSQLLPRMSNRVPRIEFGQAKLGAFIRSSAVLSVKHSSLVQGCAQTHMTPARTLAESGSRA